MEIEINKEIRDYSESLVFGLSMRQTIFSFIACAVAVVVYILCKPVMNSELASWICILATLPFVFFGFFKYNGMTAEKFIKTVITNHLLTPHKLVFKADIINNNLREVKNADKEKRKN